MDTSTALRILTISLVATLLSSCTWLQPPPPAEPRPARSRPLATTPSKVTVTEEAEPVATEALAGVDDVEVIWGLPDNTVEGYVIRYGATPNSLDQEERVAFTNIEQFNDPQFGTVLRYVLRKLPRNQSVYISISSYIGGEVSEPSTTIHVPPGA